jgi:hypothetical protein
VVGPLNTLRYQLGDNFYRINRGLNLNPQSSAPSNPTNGDAYYDSSIGSFVVYDNGFWINLASQTDVAGATILNSTQFTTTVVSNSLVRVTGSTPTGIYGLTASTGGKQVIIYNDSSVAVTIYSNSTNEPTIPNRFATAGGSPIILTSGQSAVVAYDNVQQKWIIVAMPVPTAVIPNILWVAQEVSLISGITSVNVNFTTPQSDISYVVFATMENLVDATPIYQQIEVTAKTVNGFTASWNTATDTANYIMSFIIPPKTFTAVEQQIFSPATAATITLPLAQGSTAYPVLAQFQNLVDAMPQFETVVVNAKNTGNFGTVWNAPVDTNNYYMVAALAGTVTRQGSSGNNTMVVNLPVSYGTASAYALVATWQNLVDPNPKFQPVVITAKTANTVTISWNDLLDTNNYFLNCYTISKTT